MRQLTITGRLGQDATLCYQKGNDRPYLKFTIASQEFGEKDPSWISAISFSEEICTEKIANTLKKGSAVIITGKYSDNLYNTKTGEIKIGRNIKVTELYFNSTHSKSEENIENNNESEIVIDSKPKPNSTDKVKNVQQSKSSETKIEFEDDENNLPF